MSTQPFEEAGNLTGSSFRVIRLPPRQSDREPPLACGMPKIHLRAESKILETASAIAKQLDSCSYPTPDDGVTWFGPIGYGTELTPLRLVQLGPNLYDGTTGVAVLFAALEHVRGGGGFKDTCLRVIAPLRRKLAELSTDPGRADSLRISVGGLIGLGSLIYGLLTIGELLGEPSLIHEAHCATLLMTSKRITRDQQARIQTGCAGAILALLALHRRLPGPNSVGKTPLDLATECARHLIKERFSFEGRPRAWALSPGKPPLAGFSYGAAGVSYSLLRLHEVTDQQEVWQAAQEGRAFVRSLYEPKQGSWRDLRAIFQARYRPLLGTWKDWWASGSLDDLQEILDPPPPEDYFPTMWCHGAAGIALGRIASLHLDDTPEAREEIVAVLQRAMTYSHSSDHLDRPDDLCCGHMGLIELLLCASRRLGEEDLLTAAAILMERVLSRAEERGYYELSAARGKDVFAPSLFQGIAGVGYTLLRLLEPDTLPCLLLLE